MWVSVLSACMPAPYVLEAEDHVRSGGTGVTIDRKPPCKCWELNPGPLEEQPLFLTTEPFLQTLWHYFYVISSGRGGIGQGGRSEI